MKNKNQFPAIWKPVWTTEHAEKKQIVAYKIAGFSALAIINSLSKKSKFNLKMFCTENEAVDSIHKREV